MSSTAPTLFSGEYIEAVRASAANVKGTVAKNIIRTLAYDYAGVTHERNLMAECSKNSWGKTRQSLQQRDTATETRRVRIDRRNGNKQRRRCRETLTEQHNPFCLPLWCQSVFATFSFYTIEGGF